MNEEDKFSEQEVRILINSYTSAARAYDGLSLRDSYAKWIRDLHDVLQLPIEDRVALKLMRN